MNRPRILPPTYFSLAIVTMVALHFLVPISKIIPSPWNAIGVIFLLAGALLSFSGERLFRQAGTTVMPYRESSTLVTQGVFRLSRNPMYLGFALFLGGVALLLGSLSPVPVLPAFVVLIETRFIRVEERLLVQKFGQAYLDYKRRVRRWL